MKTNATRSRRTKIGISSRGKGGSGAGLSAGARQVSGMPGATGAGGLLFPVRAALTFRQSDRRFTAGVSFRSGVQHRDRPECSWILRRHIRCVGA
jgi:hypothetical protein